MAKLSGIVRSRLALRRRPLDEHLEAELLSAFVAQALPARARDEVVAHLAGCMECREVLLFSTADSGAAVPNSRMPGTAGGHFWLWPAAAVLAGLMVAIVFAPRRTGTVRQEIVMRAQPRPATNVDQTVHGLEAPPVIMPRLGLQNLGLQKLEFQSVDTSNLGAGASPRAVKSLVDTSTARPRQNSVWRIEDNGAISKSPDGKMWIPVPVDQQTRLYALAVDGAEVWTGGTRGNLFHSTDDGAHWQHVEVQSPGGTHLINSITKIDFTPRHPLAVTTDTGAVWVSYDGRLWHQP